MGDWIKENKFESALIGIVVLMAGVVYFFGGKWDARYVAAQEQFTNADRTLKKFRGKKPSPTKDGRTRDEFEDVLRGYRDAVSGLQEKLLAFRPETFEQIAPADFTTRLNENFEALKELYASEGTAFPETWRLGFEQYTDTPPRDEATAYLAYQLEALRWLFESLAKGGADELLNVHRESLPVEGRGEFDSEGAPYDALPLELTFRASEPVVRDFLALLANSKEHFFVVRFLRIQNVKFDTPPKSDDVDFPDAPAADPIGNFTFDPDDPDEPDEPGADGEADAEDGESPDEDGEDESFGFEEEQQPAGGDRILGQILGGEKLNVFLKLELLLFRGDEKLPELK